MAIGSDDALINIYAVHDRGQTYRKFNMPLKVRDIFCTIYKSRKENTTDLV